MLFHPAQLGLAHLDKATLEADKKACKKIGPCGVGKKVQKFIPPVCKVVMIVSGAVALLSCVGWLISRKKFA